MPELVVQIGKPSFARFELFKLTSRNDFSTHWSDLSFLYCSVFQKSREIFCGWFRVYEYENGRLLLFCSNLLLHCDRFVCVYVQKAQIYQEPELYCNYAKMISGCQLRFGGFVNFERVYSWSWTCYWFRWMNKFRILEYTDAHLKCHSLVCVCEKSVRISVYIDSSILYLVRFVRWWRCRSRQIELSLISWDSIFSYKTSNWLDCDSSIIN